MSSHLIDPKDVVSMLSFPKPAIALCASIAIALVALTSPQAIAAEHRSIPNGYFGPVDNCPGNLQQTVPLRAGVAGNKSTATVEIWASYSSSSASRVCAIVRDNREGSHHMEVVMRRDGWKTPAFESGDFPTFAGGVGTWNYGDAFFVFARMTHENGINYEARLVCQLSYYPDPCFPLQ